MSAPPPGGSPPPQQPPTYPQYQQPPQGYPPQYPPQQPYYPQPTPPPQKSNTALIIVLVVVIIVVVLAVLAWWAVTALMAPVTNTRITVTSVSFTIDYQGAATGYFGSSSVSTCTNCPFTVSFMSNFNQNIILTNTGSAAHNVTDITIAGTNFTIITTAPSLPSSVGAGLQKTFVVTIQPTTIVGGSYAITGVIDTS